MNYYAHSKEDQPTEHWQPLEEHLNNVSLMAAGFAESFGGQQWAEIAGKFHDLGKGTKAWQAWLRKVNDVKDEFTEYYEGHHNHAAVGAIFLAKSQGQAYCWLMPLLDTMPECPIGQVKLKEQAWKPG